MQAGWGLLRAVGPIAATMVYLLAPAAVPARAAPAPQAEEAYRKIAVDALGRYGKPVSYTYKPHSDGAERAASAVAITGHVLLEGYRATKEDRWLASARIAADTLIAHGDMNNDGKVGWGRHWKLQGPSGDGQGGNTSFAMGCSLARNQPYDDEFYDNARITHFLFDIYRVTKDRRYLKTAKQAIDDSWEFGEPIYGDGFSYWKTIGPCDRGWHVKNINMLMAVPMALLSRLSGEPRYRQRLDAMMKAQRHEIRYSVDGRPAPNLGYYARQTMLDHPSQGTYVKRAQSTDPNAPVDCNPKTGSGESCTYHLGLEARSMDLVVRITGNEGLASRGDILAVMRGMEERDTELCANERTALGHPRRPTACIAYYCALRRLSSRFDEVCRDRIAARGVQSPDIMLGLFWGAPTRAAADPHF